MTAPVETIDFDAVFEDITARLKQEERRRLAPAELYLFDGDWNLRGEIKQEISVNLQFLDDDAGIGVVDMPVDYYLSRWCIDVDSRPTTNIHLVARKDGAEWSGRCYSVKVLKTERGERICRISFKHDREELKYILGYANPFLPPEVQFPKSWVLFGRARWCLKTTLLVNLMRLESSLWTIPDNPLDPSKWFNFDQSTWWQVVKPDTTPDNSVGAIINSRFKTMHDLGKRVVADAQLTWEPRRYLPVLGDEPPWDGADLRNGCLVWDLIDKSGWNTGTSFGGSTFGGLLFEAINFGSDGITENRDQIANPNVPIEYQTPGFKGTAPSMPGVVFLEGEHTGIQSSEWEWSPATAVGFVAGGHSMPGVNEAISAAIQMAGDLIAAMIGVPPIGGAADALLRPLYTDVLLAFGKIGNQQRAQRLGGSRYHESFAAGADRAYTLAYLVAQRAAQYASKERVRAILNVADGAPWRIGQHGKGHFFLGDRVAFNVLGMPPGKLYVERVSELVLSWSRTESPNWKITIGEREPEDPAVKALQLIQDAAGALQDLGVL
ncbi:Gp37-like protein [Rhodococcus zopfii]